MATNPLIDLSGLYGSQEGRTKQARDIMPGSAGEMGLQGANIDAGQLQALALQQMLQQSAQGSPLAGLQNQIEAAAGQGLLQHTQGGGAPNAAVMQLINSIYDPIQAQAQSDLERAARGAAASRGMAISDSPIGRAYLNSSRDLLSQFGSQRAQAALNQSNTMAGQNMNLQQLQNNLRNQALQSRMQMSGMSPGGFGLQQQLWAQRLQAAPVTQTNSGTNWGARGGADAGRVLGGGLDLGIGLASAIPWGSIGSGIGSLASSVGSGIGNLFSGWNSGESDYSGLGAGDGWDF